MLESLLLQPKACKTFKITDLAQGIFKMPEEVLPEEFEKSKIGSRTASAGKRLREERLSRGIKRTTVAEKLHITNHYVKAIESDSFDKLPGAIFIKGYLKNYAELLHLNPTEIIGLYEKTVSEVGNDINSRVPSYKLKTRNQVFLIASVILFIFLFVFLWVYDNIFKEESTKDFAVAVAIGGSQSYQSKVISNSEIYPPRANELSISENNSVFSVQGKNVTPDYDQFDKVIDFNSPGQDTLDILFSGESWIEITDEPTGERFREIMIAGDLLRVKGKAPFSVLISDAPAARIRFNGAEISLMDSIRIDNSASLTLGM